MRRGRIILFVIIAIGTILGCATTSRDLKQVRETWPTTAMTKDEMMNYFKNNFEGLDPIEGVWVMSENTNWVNVISGLRGKNESSRLYVFAVMRG